jgi:hypothetical protein
MFKYIHGPNNVVADAFSQVLVKTSTKGFIAPRNANLYSIEFDDKQLLDCFLNHLLLKQIRFPLGYAWICQHQLEDEQFQEMQQLKPLEYPIMDMGNDIQLVC